MSPQPATIDNPLCTNTCPSDTCELITSYYKAFNALDWSSLLKLVSEDVVHDISPLRRECGRSALSAHLLHTQGLQREHVFDIVVMTDDSARHAAAEYMVLGFPLEDCNHPGECPPQTYRLSMGAFFEIEAGHICRISQYGSTRGQTGF